MKVYLKKLDSACEETIVSNYEKKILQYLWKFFKIELPPYKFLPLIYNFFIIYLIVFLLVSVIIMIPLMVYAFLESFYDAVVLYELVEQKFFNTVSFGTFFWLFILALTRTEKTWCNYSIKYWKSGLEPCINTRTKLIFMFFSIVVVFIGIFIFEEKFIRFSITTVSIIIIYNVIVDLILFSKIKNWKQTPILDIQFKIFEEREIANANIGEIKKIKLYSLNVLYKYVLNGKEYFSSQVYPDELAYEELFKNRQETPIRRWIIENENKVKYTYVNLSNVSQSVLYKDIKGSSYIGKIIVLIGALLLIVVINSFINLEYYFSG